MKIKILMQNGEVDTYHHVRAVHIEGYGTIEDRDDMLVLDVSEDDNETDN